MDFHHRKHAKKEKIILRLGETGIMKAGSIRFRSIDVSNKLLTYFFCMVTKVVVVGGGSTKVRSQIGIYNISNR